MARKLRTVTDADILNIRVSLQLLTQARRYLRVARAKRAHQYVGRAIKSVEGAARHALRAQA